MSKIKDYIDMSQDFSFSFVENDDNSNKYDEEIEKITNQRDQILNEINKLLENLKKEPEKDTIKWPNRVPDIEKFQEKLQKIIS